MCNVNLSERLSQARVHLVTDRASLFTDHRMSGLPIHAKNKNFKTICERTCDNSPTDSSSSFLKWCSSKQGLETLKNCLVFFFSPIRMISQRMFEHELPCYRTTQLVLHEVFPTLVIFQLPQKKYVIRTSPCIARGLFRTVCIHVEYIPNTRDQEMMFVHPINILHQFLMFCFFPAFLMSSTYTYKDNPWFRWTNRHSQFGTFSHSASDRISSNCLSSGCPYKFLPSGTTGPSMFINGFGNIQGVSPYWGVMLTQAPIWGNRVWETKFLFHAPVSLDWGTFRLTPLCTFPNFPRLWLRVGVALFLQIGVVLRRKVWNFDVYSHLFHPIGACFPRLGWSSQKTTFSELAMCKTTDNFIWVFKGFL